MKLQDLLTKSLIIVGTKKNLKGNICVVGNCSVGMGRRREEEIKGLFMNKSHTKGLLKDALKSEGNELI